MNIHFKEALDAELIEPATGLNNQSFIVDGVQYYQAKDNGISMLMGRFHALGDMIRKHDTMKLTDELVRTSFGAIKDLQRRARAQIGIDPDQTLDCIQETIVLVQQMETRRELGLDVAQVFDVASIFFFSENEDPAAVDDSINRKKIAQWLASDQAKDLYRFFLHLPLGQFVPLPALLKPATLTYMQDLSTTEYLQWMLMNAKSDQLGLTSDTISTIESRMETLRKYEDLTDTLLNPTMTTSLPGAGNSVG